MTGEGSYPPGDLEAHQARSALRTPVGRVRPVLTVVPGPDNGAEDPNRADGGRPMIDELVREGARRMLAEALQAEVDAYIARTVRRLRRRTQPPRKLNLHTTDHPALTRPAASACRRPWRGSRMKVRSPAGRGQRCSGVGDNSASRRTGASAPHPGPPSGGPLRSRLRLVGWGSGPTADRTPRGMPPRPRGCKANSVPCTPLASPKATELALRRVCRGTGRGRRGFAAHARPTVEPPPSMRCCRDDQQPRQGVNASLDRFDTRPVRGAPSALPAFRGVPVISRCPATPAAGLLLRRRPGRDGARSCSSGRCRGGSG
jgi:hypothetical protein